MSRFILKTIVPTLREAKEIVPFNEFYVEVKRGWLFFDSKKEVEDWFKIEVVDEQWPF